LTPITVTSTCTTPEEKGHTIPTKTGIRSSISDQQDIRKNFTIVQSKVIFDTDGVGFRTGFLPFLENMTLHQKPPKLKNKSMLW